ncbi:hypothetical protein [Pseudalkalibacillus caeni]|uniref:ZIP Zinc transporter n=1 Tax=Exobacillus caeni TaxID=2574798 RepID=A0A5R9FA21_9BACL|nr:hypothetical protein [Pseudalkalibacillus caeni]TLS36505.1 hypothetical protein FCL54_14930 [Pseudalkalibacillus caeni]
MLLLSFIFVIVFSLIHFFSKNMRFITYIPRSKYLSVAGGVAVAYVFLHLLPEISESQKTFEGSEKGAMGYLSNHAYLFALAGLFLFYALDRMVKTAKKRDDKNPERADSSVFWIHISSFFVYNALIGYLLVRDNPDSVQGMVLYFIALVVHFVTVDHNLRVDHRDAYDKYGRWLLSAAIIVGWVIGVFTEVSEFLLSMLVAFLGGSIILNVIKEELPEERKSSIGAFAIGVISYSALLLLIK